MFLQDQRRKVDFVLVYEEDKKDVDIEIPKARKDINNMGKCYFQYFRNWKELSLE